MQRIVLNVTSVRKRINLFMNANESKVMVLKGSESLTKYRITVSNKILKPVIKCFYLG